LNGVYPDPTAIVGDEVTQGSSQIIAGYPGSFLYDLNAPFIASNLAVQIDQEIEQGSSQTVVQVSTLPAGWPATGSVVFNFGLGTQEGPVKFNAVIGTGALMLDPSYVFQNNYLPGSTVRLVRQIGPFIPNTDGSDYPVYITSTSPARDLIAEYLEQIAAAGVVIQFIINIPPQKWAALPTLYASDPQATSLAPEPHAVP
jgi:hypothetical protein